MDVSLTERRKHQPSGLAKSKDITCKIASSSETLHLDERMSRPTYTSCTMIPELISGSEAFAVE